MSPDTIRILRIVFIFYKNNRLAFKRISFCRFILLCIIGLFLFCNESHTNKCNTCCSGYYFQGFTKLFVCHCNAPLINNYITLIFLKLIYYSIYMCIYPHVLYFLYCPILYFLYCPINFKKVALWDNLFDADFYVVCQLFASLYAP